MDEEDVCVCGGGVFKMEDYSALKRKEILQCATPWMDLEDLSASEISQTEKVKHCVSHLYEESRRRRKKRRRRRGRRRRKLI